MKKKLLSLLTALSLSLSLLIRADAVNADGSITKTATSCSGGTSYTKPCDGTVTGSSYGHSHQHTCGPDDDRHLVTITDYTCSKCTYSYSTPLYCPYCGAIIGNAQPANHNSYAGTMPCSHGNTSSHYYNNAYGYNGSSPTFKVWPISVTTTNGLTATVSVAGCTATDAAMYGKSVTVKVAGVSSGTKLKIVNSGTGTTMTPTASSTSHSYTFTMPAAVTTITVGLAQETQSLSASLSSTTVGYGSKPTLTVTGAKTSLSYSSSNTSVATINSLGVITLKGLGSTTFTITAAETVDYKSASTTVSLTVVKGALTTKTSPTSSSINYGQALQASTLTGGSVVNKSGTTVGGKWYWKTPATIPNVGKTAYLTTYIPTDTAHYNY